nr:ribosomal protein L7Ae/L30e/S12e/Gadd45 [Tanacetum cinerariifolium]
MGSLISCILLRDRGTISYGLSTHEEIHQFQRVESNRTIKSKTVTLSPNQVLIKEIRQDLKRWEELIRENVFGLGGHRDHLPACLALILYCILAEQQHNLACFFVKRNESSRATPKAHLPYGMFLIRLFRYVMKHYPHLDNGIYNVVDQVMHPLALRQTRKPRSDHDDDNKENSQASTPSPTTNLNSLLPLNYEKYDIPTSSQQDDDLLFERQTALLNQTQKMREEVRGGFKSFEKSLKGVFSKKKK